MPKETLQNLLRSSIAASRARSLLAYPLDMSRRSLRGSLLSKLLATVLQSFPESRLPPTLKTLREPRLSAAFRRITLVCAGTLLLTTLSGCIALLATGAATGLMVSRDRRGAGTFLEDQTLELQAGRRIASGRGLSPDKHINVNSYNLVLLLSGEAASEQDRQTILDIASKMPKVRHIFNEITLGPPAPLSNRTADTVITTQVKTSLLQITGIDLTRIKVVTERGVVYLLGLVTRKEGDAAAAQARTVGGVQRVVKLFEYPEYPAGGGPDNAPANPPAAPPDDRAVL